MITQTLCPICSVIPLEDTYKISRNNAQIDNQNLALLRQLFMGAFNNNARNGAKAERFGEKWLFNNGFILLIRGKSHGRGKGYMPYDLIVSKDGQIYEINVKSCKTHFMINPLSLCKLINGAKEKGHIPAVVFVYQRKILGLFSFQSLEAITLSKII